ALEGKGRRDVIRKGGKFGEILLEWVGNGEIVVLHVRSVIGVEAFIPRRLPTRGVRSHGEALEELPRGGHVDFGKVTLNGWGAKVGFEPGDIDLQRLERAEEQRVALETVQPHRGVRVDVLKGARNHLQARVVDLVIRQPLNKD